MCKYCESAKPVRISSYDNLRSMNISYGQYQGVSVDASLYMHGNMLTLKGYGSYRSKSDCYYEDCGIECDNKNSNNGKAEIVQIKFCPFCGRDLSNTNKFEVESAKRKIAKNKERIKELESLTNFHNVMCVNINYDATEISGKLMNEIFSSPQNTLSMEANRRKYADEMKKHIQSVCERPIDTFDDIKYILVKPCSQNIRFIQDVLISNKVSLRMQMSMGNTYHITSTYWKTSDDEINKLVNDKKLYVSEMLGSDCKLANSNMINKLNNEYQKSMKELEILKAEQHRLKEIIKKK